MMYYENHLIISKEDEKIFDKDKKEKLSLVEKIGLETVLDDFIKEYEYTNFGETYTEIKEYTRYNEDCVDILDGRYDTYVFDNYAIGDLWLTNNGCIIMTVADLSTVDTEESYDDIEEVVENCDIWYDCETRYIRLN